jgi:signal transduction histidine kinase
VVAEILEDWRARLEARGITVEVAEPLPVVYADPTALRQVLENLLANATKFMGDNPAPRIVVGGEAEGEYAHLYVRDNGIGIAPEYHDKAFEIFQRVHDRPEEIDGTGIGLAIVKKAVEMWGGRVWLESAVGQGCTVHFLAPGKEDGHDDGCHGEDAAD